MSERSASAARKLRQPPTCPICGYCSTTFTLVLENIRFGCGHEVSRWPGMFGQPIPEEALTAATEQAEDSFLAYELPESSAEPIADRIVEAAAPHIARAAQVQILREMADELHWDATKQERYGHVEAVTTCAHRLRERADQIQRSAGQ